MKKINIFKKKSESLLLLTIFFLLINSILVSSVEDYVSETPIEDYVSDVPKEDYVTETPKEDYVSNIPKEDYVSNKSKEGYVSEAAEKNIISKLKNIIPLNPLIGVVILLIAGLILLLFIKKVKALKKIIFILIIILIFSIVILLVFNLLKKDSTSKIKEMDNLIKGEDASEQSTKKIPLKEDIKSSELTYKYVTEKPTGWFKSGQEADIILYATGFNDSGGPLILNHPEKVETDGKRLIVSDTWNNRVLIWNERPTKNNEIPDIVLGQQDFNSNIGGIGRNKMNWPLGIATDGNKLLVADSENDRILIWNIFPTRNGQPADLVLGAPNFDTWPYDFESQPGNSRDPKKSLDWPWDVWTDGERVIVASTVDSSVLIWNTFPTENYQSADIVLGCQNFSMRFMDTSEMDEWPIPYVSFKTPRSISSNGEYLAIGMHGEDSIYVWKEFPTQNGEPADFILQLRRLPDEPPNSVFGLDVDNGKLFAASAHQVFIWNELPKRESESEDVRIGLLDQTLGRNGFRGADDVASDGTRVFVADTYNNRVLIFNSIPTKPKAEADIILGQPDFGINIFDSRNSFANPFPFSDGEHLFVGSDLYNKLAIYNKIPDESKATADVVITGWGNNAEIGGLSQVYSDGKRLFVANREAGRVLIWNNIPTRDNQTPDVILSSIGDLTQWGKGKGRSGLNNPMGAISDGRKLFVSDTGNNRILIWNEIPTQNQTPADLVLGQKDFDSTSSGSGIDQLDRPVQLATDGRRLAVADQGNQRILIWKTIPTKNRQPADFEIKTIDHSKSIADLPPTARLGLPAGVYIYNNSLFVADTGKNRILIWTQFPENELDEPDKVLGQTSFTTQYKSNSKDLLFMPHFLAFDGSFLWVGEMKFSNRLLRFSVGE